MTAIAASAGSEFSLAIRDDETVAGWGNDGYGQASPPASLTDAVAISAGDYHSIALKIDGTIEQWGESFYGGTPPTDSGYVGLSAGYRHNLAVKDDGTVVSWGGNNADGQQDVPAGLSGVDQVAAGGAHSLALKSDGTVVAWGDDAYGQATPPAGLSGVIGISAGKDHSLAVKSDGSVVAWGRDAYGESSPPQDLADVIAVSAGEFHSLALKSDGTVVGWGDDAYGQSTPPADLANVESIGAGDWHSIATIKGGGAVAWGRNNYGQTDVPADLQPVTDAIKAEFGFTADFEGTAPVAGDLSSSLGFNAYFYDWIPVDGEINSTLSISGNLPGEVIIQGDVKSSLGLTGSLRGGITSKGSLTLPLEVTVEPATETGITELPLQVEVVQPEAVSLPLSVTVYDASQYPGHNGTVAGGTFSVEVEVGGQDYTSRLIGSIEIDAEEGAARVANFALVLPSGAFEPDDWINLPVAITYIQDGAAFRIFTGIVDLPELSLEDNSVVLSCTDNLQGRFEDKPRSVIESIFEGSGAKWSPAVFGEYENSYQFAEDLLSTIPVSADLDRNGQLVFGQWYVAGYDFLFSDAEVFPESVSVEWGSRRDIVTQVNIDAEYTYQFLRERKHRYWWEYPRSFGQYLEDNTSLPNSAMIEQAANADGWAILGKVAYERLPDSGEYSLPSGGTTNWSISDDVRSSLAIAADFTIRKRWVQDVQESYAITVRSQPNIDRFGLLSEDVRVTLDTSADETGFQEFESEPATTPTTIGSDTAWPTFEASSISAALETAVARGETIIQGSIRQNTVAFTTLIQPELERYHFIRLESATVTAQGKCSRVRHNIDLESGSAVTDVELAIFRADAAAGTNLSYAGLNYTETAIGTFTTLYTRLQDYTGAVEEPEDGFQGYVGNYVSQLNSVPNPFEERFTIMAPAISASSRDSVEHSEEVTVEATTYNQTMTVNL